MDWIIEKMNFPPEIVCFLENVFEISEIRGKVGEQNGIKFVVHTNEIGHPVPHVHAQYGKYEVSIRIDNGEILAGSLPVKKQKIAQEWIFEHQERLLNDWNSIAISSSSRFTKSNLDLTD